MYTCVYPSLNLSYCLSILDVPRDDIIGQSIQFFAAGFDTSAVLFQFTAYELALHPEIQKKLLVEVDQIRASLKGNPLTYETVQEMKYMEMVISGKILVGTI